MPVVILKYSKPTDIGGGYYLYTLLSVSVPDCFFKQRSCEKMVDFFCNLGLTMRYAMRIHFLEQT